MPRGKDQKTISKRIDLHYWKKAHRLRSIRMILVLLCTIGAGGWLAYAYYLGDKEKIFNPGHVTSAHAIFEHDCAKCHAQDPQHAGQFMKTVRDDACITCHEAPMHAPAQLVREGSNEKNPLALAVWMKDNGMTPSKPAEPAAEPAAPAEGETPTAEAAATAQPTDAHHGKTLISAQCAACHVEHRGRDALAAVSDQHCTQCHSDLTKAVAAGHVSKIQKEVVAFAKDKHPEFGRKLKGEDGNWADPTKLRFSHKTHIGAQGLSDCSMCHTTWQPNLAASRAGHDPAKPPFKTAGERPLAWAGSSDGRYMQPISFDQHCSSCHETSVRATVAGKKKPMSIPHVTMKQARAHIAAQLREQTIKDLQKLRVAAAHAAVAALPNADEGELEVSDKLGGSLVRPIMLQRRRPGSTAKPATPAAGTPAPTTKPGGAAPPTAPAAPAGPGPEAAALEAEAASYAEYVNALGKADACGKCHDMKPEAPAAIATTWGTIDEGFTELVMLQRRRPGGAAAPAPGAGATPAKPGATAKKPAAKIPPVKMEQTEPTGIPRAPRRWFVASRFDHRSHRDMACVECHSKLEHAANVDNIADDATKSLFTAMTSETKEVLSPGMQWTVYQFNAASEGKFTVDSSKMRSCTDCHRADEKAQRFTTAACVTCHAFHDHSKELFPDGRPHPRKKAGEASAAPAPAESAAPAEGAAPAETPQ